MVRRVLLAACLAAAATRAGALPYDSLDLSFVGDIMAHNVNYRMADYSRIYRDVRSALKSDDLTFANLEAVVDPSRPMSSYPLFNVHPGYVDAAVDAGVDVFSLANNHSADWGEPGMRATLRSLEQTARAAAGGGRLIHYSGLRESEAARFTPTEITRKGWRIGYLAITQFSNVAAPRLYHHLDYRDHEQAEAFLTGLAGLTSGYDLFIVSYHGGVEYAAGPEPAMREFFYRLLDAGVHIVHGHHPHVAQPAEVVRARGRDRLILFSCGNFVSGQSWRATPERPDDVWARTGDSLLWRVTVHYGNPGPAVRLSEVISAAHYRTADDQVVITPLDTLAAAPPAAEWREFFTFRREAVDRYRSENPVRTPHNVVP